MIQSLKLILVKKVDKLTESHQTFVTTYDIYLNTKAQISYNAHLALIVTNIVMGSKSSAPINPSPSLYSGCKTFLSTSLNVDIM